jgi:crotonobetaine/carnitine-CoA ligase
MCCARPLPLFHINALNTFAQASDAGLRKWCSCRASSASGFWPAMKASGATVVYLLGAMVPILLAQPEGPIEREHRVRVGWVPGVPGDAGQRIFDRTGVPLLEGYWFDRNHFVIATSTRPRGAGA